VPLQALDIQAGGFSTLLYWMEIQDMALRAAGGQPGPAAQAAAQQLIRALPHSVVLTRLVQGLHTTDTLQGR
jgi:hypothetical protein